MGDRSPWGRGHGSFFAGLLSMMFVGRAESGLLLCSHPFAVCGAATTATLPQQSGDESMSCTGTANHSMQRMRASRLAHSQFWSPWQLARTADAGRLPVNEDKEMHR